MARTAGTPDSRSSLGEAGGAAVVYAAVAGTEQAPWAAGGRFGGWDQEALLRWSGRRALLHLRVRDRREGRGRRDGGCDRRRADGVGDDGWMADFEDADFDVFEELGGLDGVEDVLEFAFEVEDGQARGFVFVRRADGDEDLDGSGEEGGLGALRPATRR